MDNEIFIMPDVFEEVKGQNIKFIETLSADNFKYYKVMVKWFISKKHLIISCYKFDLFYKRFKIEKNYKYNFTKCENIPKLLYLKINKFTAMEKKVHGILRKQHEKQPLNQQISWDEAGIAEWDKHRG